MRIGGESIYGESFPDENYNVKLEKAGMLAMLPNGPNSNDSRFFITFVDCTL